MIRKQLKKQYPHWSRLFLNRCGTEMVTTFVKWYNKQHIHGRLRYVTSSDRHQLLDAQKLKARQEVYKQSRARSPELWSGSTRNWQFIEFVWLNKPNDEKN